jgi:hypothetical protein
MVRTEINDWLTISLLVYHVCSKQLTQNPVIGRDLNPSNAELNPICRLLALLEPHHILHVSRIRVKVAGSGLCSTDVHRAISFILRG